MCPGLVCLRHDFGEAAREILNHLEGHAAARPPGPRDIHRFSDRSNSSVAGYAGRFPLESQQEILKRDLHACLYGRMRRGSRDYALDAIVGGEPPQDRLEVDAGANEVESFALHALRRAADPRVRGLDEPLGLAAATRDTPLIVFDRGLQSSAGLLSRASP